MVLTSRSLDGWSPEPTSSIRTLENGRFSRTLGHYVGLGQFWDLTCLCLFHCYHSKLQYPTLLGFDAALCVPVASTVVVVSRPLCRGQSRACSVTLHARL